MDLRGLPVAENIISKLKSKIVPKLSVIRVGEKEDDIAYERGIIKRFENSGAVVDINVLPADCTQETLNQLLIRLSEDITVHGILICRPLPPHISENVLKSIISPEKDVDCFGIINNSYIYSGYGNGYPPCTPQAAIELLDFYGIDLIGKKVTVVGRSMVVGKPLAMLLLQRNATVTVCHTKTINFTAECKRADILIVCAGQAKMIGEAHVHKNQIVIDVGINISGGKLCGDVDYEKVADKVKMITPVPGGVGTVTSAILLKHTFKAAGNIIL